VIPLPSLFVISFSSQQRCHGYSKRHADSDPHGDIVDHGTYSGSYRRTDCDADREFRIHRGQSYPRGFKLQVEGRRSVSSCAVPDQNNFRPQSP
jgi:hypothetical protein